MPVFNAFPKIARLTRDCSITEKLDGTNAAIGIETEVPGGNYDGCWRKDGFVLFTQSRTRVITPTSLSGVKDSDNYGFAAWAYANAEELVKLGPGLHFGEWWGQGINRNYSVNDKRFSLFNVNRWQDASVRPVCCHVVPELYHGEFHTGLVDAVLFELAQTGSKAAPGFRNPEGVVVWHEAARVLFKKTLEKDAEPKGKAA